MLTHFIASTAIALVAGLASAAPTGGSNSTSSSNSTVSGNSTASGNSTGSSSFESYGSPTVHVINQCGASLMVGSSLGTSYSGDSVSVAGGATHTYTLPVGWSGRIWGRTSCSGDNCNSSGMSSPASLAEFYFNGDGSVYYDISLVDGFNLPMVIAPVKKVGLEYGDDRLCATTTCSTLPSCPSGFETYDSSGKVSGCMSACTKFKTDEYCCTGAYNSADACKTNSYASQVKAACPDAYSYAYDDSTSAFMCTYNEYTVTFC